MSKLRQDDNGNVVQGFSLSRSQNVAYTGVAGVITNPVGAETTWVLIWATTACHFAIGLAPTATTADPAIPANFGVWVPIQPGHKVSFVQIAAGGNGYVTEAR